MTALPQKNLIEQQVDLVRLVIEIRPGVGRHLCNQVMPHLDQDGQDVVTETISFLEEEADIDGNLSYFLDVAIVEVRNAIAAGTYEEKVAIPRERLIGCAEAFDTYRRLTPEAEALQAALPILEQMYHAVRRAIDFAEAIRLTFRMLDVE